MIFKKLNGETVGNVSEYVKSFVRENPETKVFIGTDSQVHSKYVAYVTAICLYTPGRGGHIIYSKSKEGFKNNLHDRLWSEVETTIDVATQVRNALSVYKVVPETHFDVNPDSKHKSNIVHRAAVGYAQGAGFDYRTKPAAASWAASCVADKHC